jgi:hypothetical protein
VRNTELETSEGRFLMSFLGVLRSREKYQCRDQGATAPLSSLVSIWRWTALPSSSKSPTHQDSLVVVLQLVAFERSGDLS